MPSFTFTPTGKHLLLQYIQYLCFYKLNVLQHRPFPIFTNFLEHKNTKQCAQNLSPVSQQKKANSGKKEDKQNNTRKQSESDNDRNTSPIKSKKRFLNLFKDPLFVLQYMLFFQWEGCPLCFLLNTNQTRISYNNRNIFTAVGESVL